MEKIKKKLLSKQMIPYYILLVVALLVGFPLIKIRILDGHDSIFQLFRHNSTIVAIKDGQLIPMINPNMIGGFGYGANIFYGVLSTYIVSFINLFSTTLGLAINFFIFCTIFLSGVFMYSFSKDILKKDKIALLASILYMIGPYRLFDIYVRGALGEVMAFMFIPLLFHGLYNILKDDGRKWYLLTIGTAGLLLSHNVSTFMAAIFAFIYLLINVKKIWKKDKILKISKALLIAVLLSLITIGPLLEAKLSSNYMVFDNNYMNTTGTFMEKNSLHLFSKPADNPLDISFLLSLTMLIISFIIIWKKKNKSLIPLLLLGILSLILILPIIPWSSLPNIFSIFQYPWRFLQFSLFFASITFAGAVGLVYKKDKWKTIFIISLITLTFSIPLIKTGLDNNGIVNSVLKRNELKLRGDIARSNGTASAEYLPRNVIYKYDYLKDRGLDPTILKGTSTIFNTNRDGTKLTFEITVSDSTTIELPYIYYPGYIVKTQDKKIKTFETKNGLLGIKLEKGTYKVQSYYRGTTVMIASYVISITTLTVLTYIIVKDKKSKKL